MSMGYENNNYSRNNNGGNNGDRNNNVKEPVVYSKLEFSNPESKVDATKLTFQFTYGLLRVSISPRKVDGNQSAENVRFDYNNTIDIWMSHNHAYILRQEMRRLLEVNDPNKLKYVGIATKKDVIINFGFGVDYGTENFIMSISKLAPDGAVQSSYVFEFSDEGYSSIVNFDMNTKKFEKNQIRNLEVEMIITLLDEYIKSSNGAYAYMNQYYDRFNDNRKHNMLAGLCEKMGINVGNKPNYSRNGNGGFFSNNGNYNNESLNGAMNPPAEGRFRESSLDDMTSEYDDME